MPVPPPTLPSSRGPPCRGVDRLEDVLPLDVKAVDVVQPAIIGLTGDRQSPVGAFSVGIEAAVQPLDCGIAGDTTGVSVGDGDRTVAVPDFVNPPASRELAIAVEAELAGPDRETGPGLASRDDGRDSRAHRPGADDKRAAFAANECRVPDLDAADVGDGVERPRTAFEGNPQRPGSWLSGRRGEKGRGHGPDPFIGAGSCGALPVQDPSRMGRVTSSSQAAVPGSTRGFRVSRTSA